MTDDTMSHINRCPRCGSDETGAGYSFPSMQGEIQCYADGCEIATVGDTEDDAIRLWNSGVWHLRVTECDQNGNPIYSADGVEAWPELLSFYDKDG